MKKLQYTTLFFIFLFCALNLFAQNAVSEFNFYSKEKQRQSDNVKLLETLDRHLGAWLEKNYTLPEADDALVLRAEIEVLTRQYPKAYITLLRQKYEFPNSANSAKTKDLMQQVLEKMPKAQKQTLQKAYEIKSVPKNTDDRIAQFLSTATKLEIKGTYHPLNEQYESFFARFPVYENKDKIELMLGDWERANKNYQAAIMQYKKVYDIYPSTKYKAASLRMLGDIYAAELKDYTQASYYYNNVLKNFPNSIEIATTYHHLAIMNENQKAYPSAVDNINKAAEVYLKNAQKNKAYEAYLYKAELQNKRLKNYAGAVDTLNQTADIFKNDQNKFTDAKNKAAEIYSSKLKDRYGELAAYESIIANYPNCDLAPKASYRSGQIYESLNQNDKAKEIYQKLIVKYPADAYATKAQKRLVKIEKNEQKNTIKTAAVPATKIPQTPAQQTAPISQAAISTQPAVLQNDTALPNDLQQEEIEAEDIVMEVVE